MKLQPGIWTDGLSCVHGQLARSCNLCELESEIERLTKEREIDEQRIADLMGDLGRVAKERDTLQMMVTSTKAELQEQLAACQLEAKYREALEMARYAIENGPRWNDGEQAYNKISEVLK